jgi:hypothetical protein
LHSRANGHVVKACFVDPTAHCLSFRG